MAGWEGEHGIWGKVNEAACVHAMGGEKHFPDFYEVSAAPVRVGNAMVYIDQGDFHVIEEYNPCIAARLSYEDPELGTCVAAEVFAPFKDPDTGEERSWAQVAREAYTELVDAVLWRLF